MHDDSDGRRPAAAPPEGRGLQEDAVAHLDGLFATALRLTRDRAAAEDLVQDTYLKAARFAHRFEPGTNLRAWLFTILHNTFRNERRDAARDPVEVDSETVDVAAARGPAADSPEHLLVRDILGPELQAALDAVPEAFRQAVWLRDVEDFTYAEIAEVLGVPQGTVMSRISRGRRLLLRHLQEARSARTGTDAGRAAREVEWR